MSGTTTPRSRSRSKRSSTNLKDLRLAPLSSKYADPPRDQYTPKTPYDESTDAAFSRQHPSYLQGRSAPTSPGILSRSSSRRSFGAGLSRKEISFEDDAEDEVNYAYAAPTRSYRGERADFGSGQIPKAKSDAAIALSERQRRLSTSNLSGSNKRPRHHTRSKSGIATPKSGQPLRNETWLTHTGAIASALVQEDKGLSWLASRAQSTAVAPPESEDDDDDQYEEMAALSASTAQLQLAEFEGGSPVSTRVGRWGSRYGSRSVSRRTSRLASPAGTRTPRPARMSGYFEDFQADAAPEGPFVKQKQEDDDDDDEEARKEIERLSAARSFGLGNMVDRIMNLNVFKGDEGHETTDDEAAQATEDETPEQANERQAAEARRRKEEKQKLLANPPPAPLGGGKTGQGEVGGLKDAAWLLSIASRAMFS